MSRVTFHNAGGGADIVHVPPGTSLMRAAVTNGVPGIIGECGGQAMCATCHVYVRDRYLDALPGMSEDEDEMLDCAAAARDDRRSRLGCQIVLADGLDGIEVDVPASQV